MNLLFWGDIMPGGILPYVGIDPLTQSIIDKISGADFVIGTLECAIGDNLPYDSVKMAGRGNIIYAPTTAAELLVKMRFSVVSLANNHIFDLGKDGLISTIELLKKKNIQFTGAGLNIEEALRPAVVEKNGVTVAFIGGCTYDSKQVAHVPVATKDSFGIAPLEGDEILSQIRNCKRKYDYVVLLAHWGKEYTYFPLKSSISLSKSLIDAGADLIIGSHPHMVQPKVVIKGKDVFFSLGNGLFPDFLMNVPRPIWYPNPSEITLSSIPVTNDYPYPVTEPLLRKWPKDSRLGMLVTTVLSTSTLRSDMEFIELGDDNSLRLRKGGCINMKLKAVGTFLRSSFYDEGLLVRRIRSVLGRIKRKLIN